MNGKFLMSPLFTLLRTPSTHVVLVLGSFGILLINLSCRCLSSPFLLISCISELYWLYLQNVFWVSRLVSVPPVIIIIFSWVSKMAFFISTLLFLPPPCSQQNLFFKEKPEWALKNVNQILLLPFSKPCCFLTPHPSFPGSVWPSPCLVINLDSYHFQPPPPKTTYTSLVMRFRLQHLSCRSRNKQEQGLCASFPLWLGCDFPKSSCLPPSLLFFFRPFPKYHVLRGFLWSP